MNKRSIDFKDLETDRAGIASQAAFVALANQLIDDGGRPHTVFRAMLHAAYEASLARSIREYYEFASSATGHAVENEKLAKTLFDADFNFPETQAFLKEIDIEAAMKEAEEAIRD